jgi:hypothetical protein
MLGVYSYGEPVIPDVPYHLFYTLDLPVGPWRKDIDVKKDIVDKIEWYKPYRQWLVDTDDIISNEYKDFCYSLGLRLMDKQLFFACQEGYKGYRHRDVHVVKAWGWGTPYNSSALNYLLTPAIGSLDFWDLKEGGSILDTESDTQYEVGIEHDNSNIITRWTGQDNAAPVLLRTEAAHQATNFTGPGPRVTLTLRFHLNPHWYMTTTAFSPFFINGY